jgi:hypothetical protein
MGLTTARRFHKFTIPRKWAWELIETDETIFYRRIGNVSRFNPPGEEALSGEDLDRDVWGDLDETDER